MAVSSFLGFFVLLFMIAFIALAVVMYVKKKLVLGIVFTVLSLPFLLYFVAVIILISGIK